MIGSKIVGMRVNIRSILVDEALWYFDEERLPQLYDDDFLQYILFILIMGFL
jgi:hypothetical protein